MMSAELVGWQLVPIDIVRSYAQPVGNIEIV